MTILNTELKQKLTEVVNEQGIDARLSIPDYILGEYLFNALESLSILKIALLNHEIGKQ